MCILERCGVISPGVMGFFFYIIGIPFFWWSYFTSYKYTQEVSFFYSFYWTKVKKCFIYAAWNLHILFRVELLITGSPSVVWESAHRRTFTDLQHYITFRHVRVPGETALQAPVCSVSLIIAYLYCFISVLLSLLIFLVSIYLFFTGLCLN